MSWRIIEELPLGEDKMNGWYVNAEEYDKLHTAATKLLSAINKLPIGSFSLLETEYENLKKVLHG